MLNKLIYAGNYSDITRNTKKILGTGRQSVNVIFLRFDTVYKSFHSGYNTNVQSAGFDLLKLKDLYKFIIFCPSQEKRRKEKKDSKKSNLELFKEELKL